MSKKHESLTSSSLYYCFVDFASDKDTGPFTYVVPASVVALAVAEAHQAWLTQPGMRGQQRNDNDMRRFRPSYDHLKMGKYETGWLEPYREAWHLLEQKRPNVTG